MKVCSFCAEEIQDAAIVCKHCGRDLPVATPVSAPPPEPATPSPSIDAVAAVPTASSQSPLRHNKRRGAGLVMAILGFLMTPVSATAGFGILVLWVGLGLALKGNALLRWGGAFVLAMIAGGVGLALGGNAPAPTSMTTSSRASATATPATSVSNIDKSTSPKRTAARDSREHATTVAMWGVKIAPITDALGREVRAVSVAASNMNVSAMVESCRTMKRSVRSLSNELPAPDSEIDAALSAVVSEFTQAADSCIRGGTSLNASEIEQASKHMLAGGGHLSRASARVTELSRYIR